MDGGEDGRDPLRLVAFADEAPRLDPATLGRLIALYEHKVFTQGVLWGINSFDQWGVELGKTMASQLAPALTGERSDLSDQDGSTVGLVCRYRSMRAAGG